MRVGRVDVNLELSSPALPGCEWKLSKLYSHLGVTLERHDVATQEQESSTLLEASQPKTTESDCT